MKNYISTSEAAALLGIHPQQVVRRIKRRRSKKNKLVAKKVGTIWMVLRSSLEANK